MKKETTKEAQKEPSIKKTEKSKSTTTKAAKTKKKEPEHPQPDTEAAAPKAEESVLIMACLNPVVAKAATEAAKSNGVEVVILEDKVIADYLKAKEQKQQNRDSITTFLSNESNRRMAKEHQMKLWNILTRNAPIEVNKDVVKFATFSRTQVVKMTTMSHSQAADVLQMLDAFGYIKFEPDSKFRFVFVFDDEDIKENMRKELEDFMDLTTASYLKYESAVVNEKNTKDEILDNFIADFKKRIRG